jgi:hypothetical protein
MSVAQGALPLAPVERLVVLVTLLADPAEAVRAAARQGWEETPVAFFLDAVRDPRLPGPVLDLVAATRGGDAPLIRAVLSHPRVGPKAFRRFLDSEDGEVLGVIAQNQRALQHHREVAQELVANPALHPDERGRLISLYDLEIPGQQGARPEAAQREEDEVAPPEPNVPLPAHLSPALTEDGHEAEEDPKNLYQQIQALSVAEKIKLAYLGSKDARRLLSRDTNRVVQRAVLQSPKIREDEVLPIVQDRTVSEEILRLVMGRKDWLKSYPIRLALCQNPKTPAPRALRLLETLQDRDLRQISKSRNVSSPISAGAVRILARRGKV